MPKKKNSGRIWLIFCTVLLLTAGGVYAIVRANSPAAVPPPPPADAGKEDIKQDTVPVIEPQNPPPTPMEAEKTSTPDTEENSGDDTEAEESSGEKDSGADSSAAEENMPEKGIVSSSDPSPEEDVPKRSAVLSGEALADYNEKISQLESDGDIDALRQILAEAPEDSDAQLLAGAALGRVNVKSFAAGKFPGIERYTVRPGDNLTRIARRNGMTLDALLMLNRIDPAKPLHAGRKLLICSPVFSVKISKSARLLKLFCNGEIFKVYEIGVGRFGKTPLGAFTVGEKLKTPAWYPGPGKAAVAPGDSANQLGTRYIALLKDKQPTGYGIHGVRDESSVGRSLSNGCLRMKNSDVEELYVFLPSGAAVEIMP